MNRQRVDQYLSELKTAHDEAVRSGHATPELSYRHIVTGFLEDVLREAGDEYRVTQEPVRQGPAGRPDWLFHNQLTYEIAGYGEHKPLARGEISFGDHRQQLENYLSIGRAVFLTDGVEFVFFQDDLECPRRFSLASKPLGSAWETSAQWLQAIDALRSFVRREHSRRFTAEELMAALAMRARLISGAVERLVDAPLDSGADLRENQAIAALHELQNQLGAHHDSSLAAPQKFSGFVAQVLVFGLFYAVHFAPVAPGRERGELLSEFWTDVSEHSDAAPLRPFVALVQAMGGELQERGTDLHTWYQDTQMLLSFADLVESEALDYHLAFESFLRVFDNQMRMDFGVFFTDPTVIEFAVACLDPSSRETWNEPAFADATRIVDPACGTGGFLERLVGAAGTADVHMAGIEVLPAPYALAHLRIRRLIPGDGIANRVKILLANTLSNDLAEEEDDPNGSDLFAREMREARRSTGTPLKIIIGNPPSSDSPVRPEPSRVTRLRNLIDDWRPPAEFRTSRQNTQKQLNNEATWFLRWATHRAQQSDRCLVCLVLPGSFAENESYKWARKWLFEHCSSLRVLQIDADLRAGSGTNLWATQQGRLLLLAVFDRSKSMDTPIFGFADIRSMSPSEKREWLRSSAQVLSRATTQHDATARLTELFTQYDIDTTTYCFGEPRDPDALWDQCWALYPPNPDSGALRVFERTVSGVKIAPSSLVVHVDRAILIRRTRELGAAGRETLDVVWDRWFGGQRKPPSKDKLTTPVLAELRRIGRDESVFVPYTYRPFVSAWAAMDDSLLRTLACARNSGTRARPELQAAYRWARPPIGLLIAPGPGEISDGTDRFVSFCRHLPDNDVIRRGNALALCSRFPEYKPRTGEWDSSPVSNVSPAVLAHFAECAAALDIDPEEGVVFYCYGIMSSGLYRSMFARSIYHPARPQDPVRVPIVADSATLLELTRLGREAAALEEDGSAADLAEELTRLPDLLPGEFALGSVDLDCDAGTVSLKDRSRSRATVATIHVPDPDALALKSGGWGIIEQWWRLRTFPYLRRNITRDDIQCFAELLGRLAKQQEVLDEIDLRLAASISEGGLLPPGAA